MANDTGQLSMISNASTNSSLTAPNMFQDFFMAISNPDGPPYLPLILFLILWLHTMILIICRNRTGFTAMMGSKYMLLLLLCGPMILSFFVNFLFLAIVYHARMQNEPLPLAPAFIFFAGNLIIHFHYVWMHSKSLYKYDIIDGKYTNYCLLLASAFFVPYLVGTLYTYHKYLPKEPTPRNTEFFFSMFKFHLCHDVEIPYKNSCSEIDFKPIPVISLAAAELLLYVVIFSANFGISFVKKVTVDGRQENWINLRRCVLPFLVLIDIIFLVFPLFFLSIQFTAIIKVYKVYEYWTDDICYILIFLHAPLYFIVMAATHNRKPNIQLTHMIENTSGLHIPLNRGDQELGDMELEELRPV